jgi:ATP-dependent helicase Lhr and Lhr-like helicase
VTKDAAPEPAPASSLAFTQLDPRIQRWIWERGWSELRDVQELAVPVILKGASDVVLAAATASGKTEAAFLPMLTRLLAAGGGVIIYISPLKALINDQWGRLEGLCEILEIPVYPWHGDISASRKRGFFRKPEGVVLITPESLESMLINHGSQLGSIARHILYVAVDELHAFIGSERGKQLQSLLHRLEIAAKRQIPRVALSATLGEMRLAAEFLRPGAGQQASIIESQDSSQELKLLVKGFVNSAPRLDVEAERENASIEDLVSGGELAISEHLFGALRGRNNLVFPNSRRNVELFADLLRRRCEREHLANEFWPHHGSLSREIREETERMLKQGERPATAICTTTLELGIDIGSVTSVAQIGPPPSVASLRQRLGRSGRRNDPAILRCYCVEEPVDVQSPVADQLREGLVQTIAVIELLLEKWYEPPHTGGLHLSTLVQQLLALIAQHGGVTAQQAFMVLCSTGPFRGVSGNQLAGLLRTLGDRDIIVQTDDGLLLHGSLGEKLVNHYTFYAAFATEEEYRIVTQGRTLGSLPISKPLTEGAYVIFAGRRWSVTFVDNQQKVITVVPAGAGKPPTFGGGTGIVHDCIRAKMLDLYQAKTIPGYLDKTAQSLLAEGREAFGRHDLANRRIIQVGTNVQLFPWKGDVVHNTITLMLRRRGFKALGEGLCIVVLDGEQAAVEDAVAETALETDLSVMDLALGVSTKAREKWDWVLPDDLLCEGYAAEMLDVGAASEACRQLTE